VEKNLKLKVIGGKAAGRVILIPSTGLTIGRQPPAELLLDEPSVSRQHCCIYRRRDYWLVEDLSSHNGTLVNGVPVSKEVLHPGDKIQVGDTLLRVPRSLGKLLIGGVAAAAGFLIVILLCHWAAVQMSRSAAKPESAPEQKSALAITAGAREPSSDSEPTDAESIHPAMKRPPR
jgi:predicted component of type VI protein secretion system